MKNKILQLAVLFTFLAAPVAYAVPEWCVVNKSGNVMNCSAFIDPCKQQAAFIGGACVLRETSQQQPQTTPSPTYTPPPHIQSDNQAGASGHDPTVEMTRLQTCESAAKEAVSAAKNFADLAKYLQEFHARVEKNQVTKQEQEQVIQSMHEMFEKAKDVAWVKGEAYRKAMIDRIPADATLADRQAQTSIARMVGKEVATVWVEAVNIGFENPDAPPLRFERLLRDSCERSTNQPQ